MTSDWFGIVAQAAAPQGASGGGVFMMGYIAILMALVYFMMIRPQQKKERERKALIDSIKSGDRIVFAGGLLGTVANLKDDTLVVRVADNVRLDVLRSAVLRVIDKSERVKDDGTEN